MPVYGEQSTAFPIFNGLGVSDVGFGTKDGCQHITNLVQTAQEELAIREDFILMQESTYNAFINTASTNPAPRYSAKSCLEAYTAVGVSGTDSPSFLQFYEDTVPTRECKWLNSNATSPVTTTQTFTANHFPLAFVQYKDRYYAASADRIFRISGFSTGGGALTLTDLQTSIAVTTLISFRNRIFGFTTNRIYWTDVATIGGYPETWNISFNFTDLPAVGSNITIFNAKVYKDKIYIFTDKGIYLMSATGDPINWSVILLTPNFPIYDRDQVCINKNLIFLTDANSVYQFDGSRFIRISEMIRGLFNTPNSAYSVHPYEDGVVLQANLYSNTGGFWRTSSVGFYYYNGSMWADFAPAGNDAFNGLKTVADWLPYKNRYAGSFIYYESATQGKFRLMALDKGQWAGDVFSTNHAGGTRVRKEISLVGPRIFQGSRKFVKFKSYFLHCYMNDADPTLITFQGISLLTTANRTTVPQVVKWPVSSTQSKFSTNTSVPIVGGTVGANNAATSLPGFVIYGMEVVYNDDDKERPDVSTV